MKRIAIVQSNYIPWKGYFDLIASVDAFILYDDMQYTKRDWRNRNRIKTREGLQWLTVPVKVKGRFTQPIRDTEIDGTNWRETHWRSLQHHYRQAPHFAQVAALLEPLYQSADTMLSALNRRFLEAICRYMDISTPLSNSWDYPLIPGKSERLASLCQSAGGTTYVSGPAARTYLDEAVFAARGIAVEWFDYEHYPPYPQLYGDFVHEVSILDLLFNCGQDAARFMKLGQRI